MKLEHSGLPSTVEAATPTASINTHPGDVELQDPSPSSPLSRPIEEQALRTHPPLHYVPQTTSQNLSNAAGIRDNRGAGPSKQGENPRFLGIPAYQGHSYGDRSYDYMRKYPPDVEGKELDPDSRLWKVYLDECESYDNDMMKGFRDTIDALLVFAALFSSVVTGFVVQTSQALEPDYARIGASLLFEQIQVLRAAGNETRIKEIPRSPLTPDSATHSGLDVAVNWLFFASLAFALAAAFVAVLIKQWLQAFTALVPGDAKRRSLTRQFRFAGLKKWNLSEIINILPLFLHFSLAFFLIGLCLFVSHFHPTITYVVGVVTCSTITFFIVTAALPAVHLDCPYRLPILYIPACFALYCIRLLRLKISKRIPSLPSYSRPSFPSSSLRSQEQHHVSQVSEHLEASSLTWLFSESTNTSVQRIALHGANRFLQNLHYVMNSGWASSLEKDGARALRDSLPLEPLSMAALRFFTPGAQLEDARLLRDVVISSREVSDGPLLHVSAWYYALDNPYCCDFIEADVFPMGATLELPPNGLQVTPVQYACMHDRWDIIVHFLKCFPGSISTVQDEGIIFPLGYASRSRTISHEDWVTIFSWAKDQGVDFNTSHVWFGKQTVSHVVCHDGTLAALKHLISNVPDLNFNVTDEDGSTPLQCVCSFVGRQDLQTRLSMVQLLLAHGALVGLRDSSGITPLHETCCHSTPVFPVIQELLSAGADANALDNDDRLPLHYACLYAFKGFGCTEEGLKVLEALLMSTTNVNQLSTSGDTPLDVLERSDSEERRAGYSLMRKHGALLAQELSRATSPPPAALEASSVES